MQFIGKTKPFDFNLVLADLRLAIGRVPANAQNDTLLRTAEVFTYSIGEVITDLQQRVKALEAQNAALQASAGQPPTGT